MRNLFRNLGNLGLMELLNHMELGIFDELEKLINLKNMIRDLMKLVYFWEL